MWSGAIIFSLMFLYCSWNDKFELPNDFYSVSDIQDCIEYVIKSTKH